jgi:hypothetical protein
MFSSFTSRLQSLGLLSRSEARGTFLALAKRVLRLQKLAS